MHIAVQKRVGLALLTSAGLVSQTLGQPVCPPETDINSPRRTRLQSVRPDENEIVRVDLTNDGVPDLIEHWWNGKRARWLCEGGSMKWTDRRGAMVADCLQVDRDGDGFFDGPTDLNIKWVDDDGDGKPDLQLISANPTRTSRNGHGGPAHWMVIIDDDHDGVFAHINWQKFEFGASNWRIPALQPGQALPGSNFLTDYHGNSTFLKQHDPAWLNVDPRLNGENPFAFYDPDNDGCSEMSVRLDCYPEMDRTVDPKLPMLRYPLTCPAAYIAYDLDNDSGKGNEFDYDMTLHFLSAPAADNAVSKVKLTDANPGDTMNFAGHVHQHPGIKAPEWALPFFRFPSWRQIDELVYMRRDLVYAESFKPKWAQVWLTFDEDDDDHRWERVELYRPNRDVYSTQRMDDQKPGGGISSHRQADSLGDRGEWDMDNSGRGKLYVGKWDRKLHLFGAEKGAWTVDREAKYYGSWPRMEGAGPDAPSVEEVVQYFDRNNNGFFDRITFDYDGDRTDDLVIDLEDDTAEIVDPAAIGYAGMHELWSKLARENFADAQRIYRALWKKGMTDSAMDDLAIASSVGEQYDHGYWLKEQIFRKLDRNFGAQVDHRARLRKLHFSGDIDELVRLIDEIDPASRKDME